LTIIPHLECKQAAITFFAMLLANLGVRELCRAAQDAIAPKDFFKFSPLVAAVRSGDMSGLGIEKVTPRFGRAVRRAAMLTGALCLAMPATMEPSTAAISPPMPASTR
jgi:hypothetical protein